VGRRLGKLARESHVAFDYIHLQTIESNSFIILCPLISYDIAKNVEMFEWTVDMLLLQLLLRLHLCRVAGNTV